MVYRIHRSWTHHPTMEWVWCDTPEEFQEYIGDPENLERNHPLRVHVNWPVKEDSLVNASNGLLRPEEIPIVVRLLEACYDFIQTIYGDVRAPSS